MTQHTKAISRPRMAMAENDNGVDPIVKLDFVVAVLQAADGLLARKAETD